jgi:hypothetical protein
MKNRIVLIFIVILFPLLSFSQTYNPAPYCTATCTWNCFQTNIPTLFTTGAGTNISNYWNFCSGPQAYAYYCNYYVGINAGQTFTTTIWHSGNPTAGLAVFVDWDGDNLFATPGETVFATPGLVFGGTSNIPITVPGGQPNGQYRMRYRLIRFVNGTAINPCATYNEGETEDYDIYVGMPSPVPSVIATPSTICSGSSATLTAQGPGTFSWNPGGMTGSPIVISPTTSTNYTLTSSSSTCPVKFSISVTAPINMIIGSNNPSCPGTAANFSVNGANTYTWNNGVQSNYMTDYPFTQTNYTVVGQSGACTATSVVTQSMYPTPSITLASSSPSVCSGNTVALSASGAQSCTWMPGGVGNTVIVTPPGTQTYVVLIYDGTCTTQSSLGQTVVPAGTISVMSNTNNVCSGTSMTLTASGAASYSWSNGMTNSVIVVSPSVNTTYSVIGFLSPCPGETSVSLTVSPTPSISLFTTDSIICLGNSATLYSQGAAGYTWNPTGQNWSSITVSPTITTTYTLYGAIGNCTSSAMITQSVSACTSLNEDHSLEKINVFPNPFNERISIQIKEAMEISVYDVFGKKVYFCTEKTYFDVNTSDWAKGIYFMDLKNKEGSRNYKLIKN